MSIWPFLKPAWIGIGGMITGAVGAGYSFFNVLRYAFSPDHNMPPLWGQVPMAFSTAAVLTIYGIAIFWDGWLTHKKQQYDKLDSQQALQITLAIISAVTVIAVALIGAFRR